MSTYPQKVRIVEVGPRDGLQNIDVTIPTGDKVKFIEMAQDAGLKVIEAGLFVRNVPQMSDSAEVFRRVAQKQDVIYIALVPNKKGFDAAKAAGVRAVAVFASATESFSQKNIRRSIASSLKEFEAVVKEAKDSKMYVRGYVSCVLGCPFEGDVEPAKPARVAKALYDMGCDEISLGDTIGTGTPDKTRALFQEVKKVIPVSALAGHFHDTRGQAIPNIRAALGEGIATYDSSLGGLGGCPFAPGASGNVATEAVVTELHGLGIETGLDEAKLAYATQFMNGVIAKARQMAKKNAP